MDTATLPLRLLCVLAHPDDESLGTGGRWPSSAAEGVATYLVTATRGERGRFGDGTKRRDPTSSDATREAELLAAARELGLREVRLLDYPDGALDQRGSRRRRSRRSPATSAGSSRTSSITFGPDGAYGHPDHIAISQLTTAAIVCAADPAFDADGDRRAAPRRQAVLHRVEREEVGRVSGGAAQARDHGRRRGAAGGAVARLGDHHRRSTRARSGRPCGARCRVTGRRWRSTGSSRSCRTSTSARCGARRSSTASSAASTAAARGIGSVRGVAMSLRRRSKR